MGRPGIDGRDGYKGDTVSIILSDVAAGPLQLTVTWYKIHLAGEQATQWDIRNKATSSSHTWIVFASDVPVRSLLSSKVDFVPCDR